MGTGLQLTRAANLVLIEPDYEFHREKQAVARIHRIGQRNPRSYSFRLHNQGSAFEARIIKRQEERGEVHGKEIQTRLIAEVEAEQQKKETLNGEGLVTIDDQTRKEWLLEHEELLDQFPVPPVSGNGLNSAQRSRFVEDLPDVQGPDNGDL